MWKSILATLAGIVGGAAIVAVAEPIGHAIFPPPVGIDITNPEHLKTLMEKLPMGAIIAVLVAWALGAFFGGSVAAIISRKAWPAYLVGAVMLAFAAYTMVAIPHPVWFMLASIPVTLLPAWWAGRQFSRPASTG